MPCLSAAFALLRFFLAKLWYNRGMNMKLIEARSAIICRYPTAYDVIHEYDDYYSARVNGCTAYFEVREGKIIGDVWFE